MYKSRKKAIQELIPDIKQFRFDQINKALFDVNITCWDEVSTLDKATREKLQENIPWMSMTLERAFTSSKKDTHKAIVKSHDDQLYETVLMLNQREQWTVCVSSQIGCAMKCTFCATGAMGLTRSLHADEIADQYRFWKTYLKENYDSEQRISNIVFMGMGEPFANYEHVKESIHTWLKYTDLGPTKIMVSTVGILPSLEKVLVDPDWPPVQIALSLHSANQAKREEIVPTTTPGFIKKVAEWSHKYQELLGNRNHKLTFEYTLIANENDTPELARELANYVNKTAFDKVNVIPYNPVPSNKYTTSNRERIEAFKEILRSKGVTVTERETMGDDIDAACGQLVTDSKKA